MLSITVLFHMMTLLDSLSVSNLHVTCLPNDSSSSTDETTDEFKRHRFVFNNNSAANTH